MINNHSGLGQLVLLLLAIGDAHRGQTIKKPAEWKGEEEADRKFGKPDLVTVVALKVATFDFGDNTTLEKNLRDSGNYDPKSVLPYDATVDTAARNRIFVATPQVARGIPVSLSTVPLQGPDDPSLRPYPSLDMHRTTEDTITDCNTQLVSVFTTTVEECSAGRPVAYIADSLGFQLTVTDLATGVSKHLQSQYFQPKPGYFFTEAGGPSTYLPYGLYGISGGENCDGVLYVQGHATNVQGVLKKELLRNVKDGDVLDTKTQVALPGGLSGPSGPLAADPSGQLLFFPIQDDLAVYCWNTSRPHNRQHFRLIARDRQRLQYFSFMKVDPTTRRLYLGTNRFTKYLSKTIDYSDYNYRILYISLSGIVC